MPIPDYQAIMLPLLQFAGDGKEHSLREALEALAKQFRLQEGKSGSDRNVALKTLSPPLSLSFGFRK